MKLQAIGDRIIIKPIIQELNKAGLYVGKDTTAPVKKGTIISVGTEYKDKDLKEGQTLLYHAPGEWIMDIEDYVWIRYEHAIAILEE